MHGNTLISQILYCTTEPVNTASFKFLYFLNFYSQTKMKLVAKNIFRKQKWPRGR